jgi:nitrogen fixation/metabolism regulation signal transduction histidine kinase
MNMLTNDYLLSHKERAIIQWNSKHDSITRILTEKIFQKSEEQLLLEDIFRNHKSIKDIFSQLVSNYTKKGVEKEEFTASSELVKRIIGRLSVKSQNMIFRAFQLAEASYTEVVDTQKKVSLFVMVFAFMIAMMIIALSFLIHRSMVQPIHKLHEGIEIIGSGDLAYQVGTAAPDEIGQLSRAFDQMTDQLRLITVSRDDLAAETAERQRAEEALRAAVSRNLVGQMLRDLQAMGAVSETAMHRAGQELAANMGAEALPSALQTFSAMGLGSLALASADEDLGRWTFIGHDLMEMNKDDDHPTCHYTRGFLHGAVQQIAGGARVADTEATCQSMASATCRFVVQVIDA